MVYETKNPYNFPITLYNYPIQLSTALDTSLLVSNAIINSPPAESSQLMPITAHTPYPNNQRSVIRRRSQSLGSIPRFPQSATMTTMPLPEFQEDQPSRKRGRDTANLSTVEETVLNHLLLQQEEQATSPNPSPNSNLPPTLPRLRPRPLPGRQGAPAPTSSNKQPAKKKK